MHHHEVDRESLQVGAVPHDPAAGAFWAGGGMQPAAAAAHLVLVVLGDLYGDLRYLVLLVAVGHPQIGGLGQVGAALAAALWEAVLARIRGLGEGQVRPGRPRLLALAAPGSATGPRRLVRRWCPAGTVIPGRRRGGVTRVA